MEDDMLQEILNELKAQITFIKYNIKAEAELRSAFLMLIFGMVLNNLAFVASGIFLFYKFGDINGWSQADVIALHSFAAAGYGLAFTIGGGASKLPSLIDNAHFDTMLTTPRNLLLKVFTSHIRVSAIGDILYGLIMIGIYFLMTGFEIRMLILYLFMLPPVALIIASMLFLTSLIPFFVPNSVDITKSLFEIFLGPALYPGGLFDGLLKFVFIFIIPSLWVGSIPAEAMRDLDINNAFLVWFVSLILIFVCRKAFKIALRHYESGNIITLNT